MESFDRALKYLLEHEPAAFIRFALRGAVEVIRAVPTALPSRGRDVDGGCRVRVAGGERAGRRYQSCLSGRHFAAQGSRTLGLGSHRITRKAGFK